MRPRTGAPEDGGGPTLWTRRLWPVLGGTVTAVGVFGATSAYGALGLLMATAILSPFAVVTTWGLADELGIRHSRAVPIGLEVTLIVLVLLGLSELLGGYGLLVGALTGLCSPAALGLLSRLRRRAQRPQPARAAGILLDPVTLDRRFEDIVRRLEGSG